MLEGATDEENSVGITTAKGRPAHSSRNKQSVARTWSSEFWMKRRSSRTKSPSSSMNTELWKVYSEYPLLQSMLQHEDCRTSSLRREGRCQSEYPKSNEGWIKTLFIVKGRALDRIIFPWTVSVVHAALYTVIQEVVYGGDIKNTEILSWEFFFGLVLNSTLSFLLVFRLQRAAGRYWDARALWGMIVAKGRCFMGSIIAHSDHDLARRDEAIRWLVAFVIATMEMIRGVSKIPPDNLAGILTEGEIKGLDENVHPPIHSCDMVRHHIHALFRVDADTPAAVSYMRVRHLNSLEQDLNVILESCGGLERIRATPLPMVYVSHLRSFLMIALLLFPYVWGPSLRYATIPLVAATAFAWLGIEGAAAEAESPFRQDRVNALDMDGYCLGFLDTAKQQLKNHADRHILEQTRSRRKTEKQSSCAVLVA